MPPDLRNSFNGIDPVSPMDLEGSMESREMLSNSTDDSQLDCTVRDIPDTAIFVPKAIPLTSTETLRHPRPAEQRLVLNNTDLTASNAPNGVSLAPNAIPSTSSEMLPNPTVSDMKLVLNNTDLYVVDEDLFNCITTVTLNKGFQRISKLPQISDALRNYTYEKKLFEKKCPYIIRCADDDLSKYFGPVFTIMQVRSKLEKLLFPVDTSRDSSEVPCSNCGRGEKRKLDSEHSYAASPDSDTEAKKMCTASEQESALSVAGACVTPSVSAATKCVCGNPQTASNAPDNVSLAPNAIPSASSETLPNPTVSELKLALNNTDPYLVNEGLFNCIITIKKDFKRISTLIEVSDALRDYTYQKQLFDRKRPYVIYCNNDDLGKYFGPMFTVMQLKSKLEKLLSPVQTNSSEVPSSSNCDGGEKQKIDGELSESEQGSPPPIADSPGLSDVAESMCSNQEDEIYRNIHFAVRNGHHKLAGQLVKEAVERGGYGFGNLHKEENETATVNDSSDDVSSPSSEEEELEPGSVVAVEKTYDVEYEVDSDSEPDLESADSDSDIEEVIKMLVQMKEFQLKRPALIVVTDSDQEFWADDDSSDDSSNSDDVEISEEDKWKCLSCKCVNDPKIGNCEKCYAARAEWSECAIKKDKVNKKSKKKPRSRKNYQRSLQPLKKEESSSISEYFNIPSTSQENVCSFSSQSPSSSQESRLCLICCSKPIDSSIIHGKFAHSVCCYRCSRKLQHNKKACPICRRKIERVVYNIL